MSLCGLEQSRRLPPPSTNSPQEILIAGHGKGKSSGPQQLMADLQKHMPGIARRVVGTLPIDEKHSTEGQLLAAAAKYYAAMH
jgi:hypothetical protein